MGREDFNSSSILIQDIMTRALITVNRSTTALQVAKMMEQGGIGAILVQDNNNPVGIVTDRDYATRIAANDLPLNTAVENIMSSPLITINHNEPISAAAERMTTKKIRKLAVTENGKIVGIITSTDLVTQLAK
ncbi:signal transduction protein [Nitrosopumilus cobalaminigenes]|uniref:Signal transduction protein n=1 Tax=Nitrosopumilus cobalaminigenes TaxID=1470066 RepID=A0A7D5R2U4_9ARCH|nr:CBS domain-containing protein [Nitrosopumilus cobalaminigenes]QLH03179.1 signal transduction protein [Nitrosopumilus cobalaminigenes]